jgi:hypothetical protein
MYGWIWRQLPGPLVVRLGTAAALLLAMIVLLFTVVFPVVEPIVPLGNTGG